MHNLDHCMESARVQEEKRCKEPGARFTPIRPKVFQLIWESHQAAKAYDLIDRIESFDSGATPRKIYRALASLVAFSFQRLIRKPLRIKKSVVLSTICY